jgi:hypothetical protein
MILRLHAPGWLLAAIVLVLVGGAARGSESEDQRLLFDPTSLGLLAGTFSPPAGKPATRSLSRPSAPGAQKKPTTAGRLSNPPAHHNHDVAAGLGRSTASDEQSRAGAGSFDRVKLGTFSIGVETETNFKPRSPSGEELTAATYDAPHPGLVVPFIGLSAKSALH